MASFSIWDLSPMGEIGACFSLTIFPSASLCFQNWLPGSLLLHQVSTWAWKREVKGPWIWRKLVGQGRKSKIWSQVGQGASLALVTSSGFGGKSLQDSVSLSVKWSENALTQAHLCSLSASVCGVNSLLSVLMTTVLVVSPDNSLSQKLYLLFYGNLLFFKFYKSLKIIRVIHAYYKNFSNHQRSVKERV